jgi:Xaa-Pro aminopeptidase
MKDPTTEGYDVSAHEIDGMVRNLCAYALGEPHPLRRYLDLTHQQVLFEGMAEALRKERGKALAALLIAGATAEELVERTNLTKPLDVTRLVKAAGEAEHVKQAAAAKRAAAGAAATKAPKPGKKSAPLLDIPPGTRRVLTADELKALAGMRAATK